MQTRPCLVSAALLLTIVPAQTGPMAEVTAVLCEVNRFRRAPRPSLD